MEAVALGRIDAPGFFDDPLKRALWSKADWLNQNNKVLDPQREAAAAKLRLELGLSTYSREIAEATGDDFEDVASQLAQERELLHSLQD